MRRVRQVLAIIGLVIIGYFFISFIVKAMSGKTSVPDLIVALAAMIVVPAVLYIMQKLADRMTQSAGYEEENEAGQESVPGNDPEQETAEK